MDKQMRNALLLITIAIMIIFPLIINSLMHVSVLPNVFPVSGDEAVWIGFLGTFWGAVVGGVISGVLTLYGVNQSINASFKGLEVSAHQQKEALEQEIAISTAKERLKELYHPVYALKSQFVLKHGTHSFEDLSENEQTEFIYLIDRNIIYADSLLDQKLMELKWAYKQKDCLNVNDLYDEINSIIDYELLIIREQLKLPKLRIYIDEVFDEIFDEDNS
jgi:hypothetical protein